MIAAEPAHANALGGDGDPGKPAQDAAEPIVMVAQDVLAADADAQGRVFTPQIGLRGAGDLDRLQIGRAGPSDGRIGRVHMAGVGEDDNAERQARSQGPSKWGRRVGAHVSNPSVVGSIPARKTLSTPTASQQRKVVAAGMSRIHGRCVGGCQP